MSAYVYLVWYMRIWCVCLHVYAYMGVYVCGMYVYDMCIYGCVSVCMWYCGRSWTCTIRRHSVTCLGRWVHKHQSDSNSLRNDTVTGTIPQVSDRHFSNVVSVVFCDRHRLCFVCERSSYDIPVYTLQHLFWMVVIVPGLQQLKTFTGIIIDKLMITHL